MRITGNVVIAVLWIGLIGNLLRSQTPPPAVLTIDVENVVEFRATFLIHQNLGPIPTSHRHPEQGYSVSMWC
jgi:hypothetical protein